MGTSTQSSSTVQLDGEDLRMRLKGLRLALSGVRNWKLFVGKQIHCLKRGSRLHRTMELTWVRWSLNPYLLRLAGI